MKHSVAFLLILSLYAGLATAAPVVPDAGLRAEMQGQWSKAVVTYLQALKTDPAQANLWERIADIRATRLKNPVGSAQAMRKAVKYAPNDARLYSKLSQACAAIQDGPGALDAINRAVRLAPNNVEYLRARGNIATWTNDYQLAQRSFDKALIIVPDDVDTLLGAARAASRSGNRDGTVPRYLAYLKLRPRDKNVMIEYMKLEAERGDTQAVKKYEVLYGERFGVDAQYWLSMADIHELGGDNAASARALKEATRTMPNDAALYYRLAQTYPDTQAREAAAAIKRAVELDPNNLEYRRTQASMASTRANYAMAVDTYQRILAIAPGDPGAELGIARVQYWRGKLAASKKAYLTYLGKHPNVATAQMEYIVVLSELGDYAQAVERLEDYRSQFGDSINYRKHKARVLTWAERPTAALGIVDELAPMLPNDVELGYTRTIALHKANRPRDALASLARVTRLRPANDKEIINLARFIRAPLRSSITGTYRYSSDSDDIDTQTFGLSGKYVINPETHIFGGTDRQRITTTANSGYASPGGDTSVNYFSTWLGIKHRVSPRLSLDGQVGSGRVDGDHNFIYEIGADYQPDDTLGMRLSHRQDLFAVTPLATSLDIEQRATVLSTSWMPNLRYTVDDLLSYTTFSDSNNRWEAALAPRRAILRNQRVNLDLGINGRWFGFDQDPNHGYYAPSLYQRYAATVFTYWKISDDGVSVIASIGPYKDNTMSDYRTGVDLVANGTFGLYRDWFLNVQAGISDYRGSAAPGYGSHLFQLSLTRFF